MLRWEAKDKDTQTSLFKEKQGGYDHLLLTLNPPLTNKNNTLLKERLSLFKTSGSMGGESHQAI